MSRRLQLRELSPQESARLIADKKFNTLKPVACDQCGYHGNFTRRIFHVKGIRNEEDVNVIRYYMKHQYGMDTLLVKTQGARQYIDTAFCPSCQLNRVTFDIEVDEALVKQLARRTGRPEGEIREKLDETLAKLESQGRKKGKG